MSTAAEPSTNDRLALSRQIVLAALGVFICRAALSLVFIPPWQQSDEPQHVAHVELERSRFVSGPTSDPARESDILRSMAAHGWWQHYGLEIPTPFPLRFGSDESSFAPEDADAFDRLPDRIKTIEIDPETVNSNSVYYSLVAAILAPARGTSVVQDLYAMRAFSAMLGLIALWIAWRGASECLSAAGGATVAMLLALHPQFVVVSTTASPDMLANVLAAAFWWQAIVAVRRTNFVRPLLLAWVFAVGGAVADRMAMPILGGAFVVSLLCASRHIGLQRRTLAIAGCAVVMLAASLSTIEAVWHTFSGAADAAVIVVPAAEQWSFALRFTTFLFQGWWASLGLVRHVPPFWWQAIVLVLSILSAAGIARRFGHDTSEMRMVMAVALGVVFLQTAAVFWTFYTVANPHGRYLFPALVPTLILLWAGIEAWVPRHGRPYVAIALVALFAALDMAVWEFVAAPVWAG